jgi:protein TonB
VFATGDFGPECNVKKDRAAQSLRVPLAPFFAISIAVHLLIALVWPTHQLTPKSLDSIPVSLLPAAEQSRPAAERTPAARPPALFTKKIPLQPEERQHREATSRNVQSREQAPRETAPLPGTTTKNVAPNIEEKPVPPAENMMEASPRAPEPSLAEQEPAPEKSIIAKNSLPPLLEMLPRERRIPLGTNEPRYASYLENVRRAIDYNWEYPELALLYGLQGKLIVEFTILANGTIEFLTVVRSSGSTLLDEEALRAIRAAAPFPRIPPTVSAHRLLISASMEYHDGRLKYRLGQ